MRLRLGLAMVAVAAMAASASAGTVKISIVLNPAAPGCTGCTLSGVGTYDVYAQDVSASPTSPDHTPMFGIVSYGIPLLNVNDFLHRSPKATGTDNTDPDNPVDNPAGFTLLRSATNGVPSLGGVCPGTACGGFLVGGSQDTIAPTPYLIGGFGQTAGSFATTLPAGTAISGTSGAQASWAGKLLIGEGHWTPNNPNRVPGVGLTDVRGFVNGFANAGLTSVVKEAVVPEPASIALAGLAAIGLLGFRRRK